MSIDPASLVDVDPDRALPAALVAVHRRVHEVFAQFPADVFHQRPGPYWSPAEHLVHLCKSESAIARGMNMPRFLLRLRFGKPKAPTRSYADIRELYRNHLARGAKSTAEFVPAPEPPPADETEASRRQTDTLDRWQRANHRLEEAVAAWTKADLDRVVLPHPLLGRLTVREMLFFDIYHDLHHAARALERSRP